VVTQTTIRVMLVDDHAILRAGLKSVLALEPGIEVVGQADNGVTAEELALEIKPDVILMDIYLPGQSGLLTLSHIKEKIPNTRVIMLTMSDKDQDLIDSLRLGACGFIWKTEDIDDLIQGVKLAASGGYTLSPAVIARLVNELKRLDSTENLSARERELLPYLADGCSNTEIARRLFLGESTVRTYINRIIEKLHLKNRAALMIYAAGKMNQNRN